MSISPATANPISPRTSKAVWAKPTFVSRKMSASSCNASGGLGTIDAHGLKHDGDEYTNELYGKSPVTIHLKVEGGVGRIVLTEEP